MQQRGITIYGLAITMAVAIVLCVAFAGPAYAQRPAGNGSGDNISTVPLSFILDSTLDAHAQDIKENIFEYRLQSEKNNSDAQLELIKQRSEELKNDAAYKKKILLSLARANVSIQAAQLAEIADETGSSLKAFDAWSKKLREHAASIKAPDSNTTYMQSIMPMMDNISDARDLAMSTSQEAKNKKNTGNSHDGKNSPR